MAFPRVIASNGSFGEDEEVVKHAAPWPPPALIDTCVTAVIIVIPWGCQEKGAAQHDWGASRGSRRYLEYSTQPDTLALKVHHDGLLNL